MQMQTLRTFLAAMLASAALSACGDVTAPNDQAGGDAGDNIDEGVFIQRASPAVGRLSGNTVVTLSGRGFQAGNISVLVGGVRSRDVEVINDTTMFFRTPPGAQLGSVPITVLNNNGYGVAGDGFRYVPDTRIESVTPGISLPEGGETITIKGEGFADGAGTAVVFVDGKQIASNVVDDSSITFTAPKGVEWTRASVEVETRNGTAASKSGLTYMLPGFLAGDTGQGGLYHIDPNTAALTRLSPSGGVQPRTSGLVVSPEGEIFAAHLQHDALNGNHIAKVNINSTEEEVLLIVGQRPGGFTMDEQGRFYVAGRNAGQIQRFEPGSSQAETLTLPENSDFRGNGMATAPNGDIFFAPSDSNGPLFRLPAGGATFEVARQLVDPNTNDHIKGMTFADGELFAIRRGIAGLPVPGGGLGNEVLARIEMDTGQVIPIGAFPGVRMDAIAAIPLNSEGEQ